MQRAEFTCDHCRCGRGPGGIELYDEGEKGETNLCEDCAKDLDAGECDACGRLRTGLSASYEPLETWACGECRDPEKAKW